MNGTVLIVDDSPIMRRMVRKVVEMAGFPSDAVREAEHGLAALAALVEEPASLILLDLNMPVLDGEGFARQLLGRDDIPSAPIIVVSTESNKDRLDRMRALGAVGILRKPFEPEELIEIVSSMKEQLS